MIGGDEATRHTLSGGTRQLLLHPDQHRRLARDLSLLSNAIEEMLRWTAPVKNIARTVTADTEFHGTQLREDEKTILLFESANFDEKVFDEPEKFNYRALLEQPPRVRFRDALWSSVAWASASIAFALLSSGPSPRRSSHRRR